MARVERMREAVSDPPTAEEIRQKAEEGWKLAAVEWQREAAAAAGGEVEETPFGLCTTEGGTELKMNEAEEEALRIMLGMVIDDRNSLAAVADELNRRGFRTRDGGDWSQGTVFNMLPRLIEVAPRFFASPEFSAAPPMAP